MFPGPLSSLQSCQVHQDRENRTRTSANQERRRIKYVLSTRLLSCPLPPPGSSARRLPFWPACWGMYPAVLGMDRQRGDSACWQPTGRGREGDRRVLVGGRGRRRNKRTWLASFPPFPLFAFLEQGYLGARVPDRLRHPRSTAEKWSIQKSGGCRVGGGIQRAHAAYGARPPAHPIPSAVLPADASHRRPLAVASFTGGPVLGPRPAGLTGLQRQAEHHGACKTASRPFAGRGTHLRAKRREAAERSGRSPGSMAGACGCVPIFPPTDPARGLVAVKLSDR